MLARLSFTIFFFSIRVTTCLQDDFYDRMDLVPAPRPIFVKFFEESCTHCQKMKKVHTHYVSGRDRVLSASELERSTFT